MPNLALILILWFTLIALILFLLGLQDVLKKCAPASRTMKPGKVWFALIPVFGFVWQFINVMNIGKSLGNEFARLGISYPERTPGQTVGLAWCICCFGTSVCRFFAPKLLYDLVGTVGFFLWIAYWFRIAKFSRILDSHQAAPVQQS